MSEYEEDDDMVSASQRHAEIMEEGQRIADWVAIIVTIVLVVGCLLVGILVFGSK